MFGSLLSKFKSANKKTDPAMRNFLELRRVSSKMKIANRVAACFQDCEFWRQGEQQGLSSVNSLEAVRDKSSLSDDSSNEYDDSSQEEIEAAMRALAGESVSVPPPSNKNTKLCAGRQNQRLLNTAFETLASHAYGASSSSNIVRAVQPLSSTDSTLHRKVQAPVAFDIPVGDKKTVYPPARVPRRFRKRKVAPETTLEDIKEKLRAAEERKLKKLQRIKECARSRAGVSRPPLIDTSAQATAAKIAAEQVAAESKWNAEMERRKQSGNGASRNRSMVTAAQAFAKLQLQCSKRPKADETVQRKERREQNNLRRKYAKIPFCIPYYTTLFPRPFPLYTPLDLSLHISSL